MSAQAYTRIRTHFLVLGRGFDLDHIPPIKKDPGGSFSLVEMTGIESGSRYWIFNVSENPADSIADSAVGLSDIRLGRFPQNLDSFGEGDHNLTMLYVLNSQCF